MHVFGSRRNGYVREILVMICWCYLSLFRNCLKAKFGGNICFTKLIYNLPTNIKLQLDVVLLKNDMTYHFQIKTESEQYNLIVSASDRVC